MNPGSVPKRIVLVRATAMNDDTHLDPGIERPTGSVDDAGTVLVSGSNGLVGRAVLERLARRGQRTTRLVRSNASKGEVLWDPMGGTIDEPLIAAQAVVHLAGENIASGRWSSSKMESIRASRVRGRCQVCMLGEWSSGARTPWGGAKSGDSMFSRGAGRAMHTTV